MHFSFAAILLAAALGATAPPEQDPTDLPHLKLAAKEQIEKEMGGLGSLGVRDLDEVIYFTMHNGKYSPITRLQLRGMDAQRVTLRGLPGLAKINVLTNQTRQPITDYLQFFYRDLSDPKTVATYTEIMCNADSVLVSQAADLPGDGMWSVQLIEAAAPGPAAVTLYIQFTSSDGPQNRRRITGASLAELAEVHPAEVDRFVRPIFRLLRQEQTVFGVDSHAAYQVLASLCKTDAATVAGCDAAVAGLGADSFSDREGAMSTLRELGEPAAIYLLRSPARTLTAEQAMRVDMFLAAYRPLSDEQVKRLNSDADFLLDCCFSSDAVIRRLATQQLGQVTGKRIEIDPSLNGEALGNAVTALREKMVAPTSAPAPQ